MLTVASVNVNGVRAAIRRGMRGWLGQRAPDVRCLQEVRAGDAELAEALGVGWHTVHEEAAARGRAGVAVASRTAPVAVRAGLAAAPDAVHADPHADPAGRHVLLTGDLNVAHREADLKNWKGNLRKAGFLPQERAWFDRLLGDGAWVDIVRALDGEGPGPYSWWSWRGKAFDLDSGWRIDYQIASAGLAERAVKAETDRAPSYAERWSDHAPVVVRYDLAESRDGR